MKISELINRLEETMKKEGDCIIIVTSENMPAYVDVLDVAGKECSQGNKFFDAYLIVDDINLKFAG